MKKTAIASLLVGLMTLPALARDDYRMGLGAAAPRHDSSLGAIHHAGGAASLDYMSPKTGDGVTGLSGQYGDKMWGAGLKIANLDADPMVMDLFGGYSFGEFEAGLSYQNTDPDATITLAARYLGGMWNAALWMDLENELNILGFSYDMNDVTIAFDVYLPPSGLDMWMNLNVGYYQDWFVGLFLSNVSGANDADMTTALEGGYGQDNWHASLKYDLDAESTTVHASFNF